MKNRNYLKSLLLRVFLLFGVTVLLLSGCTVKPEQLSDVEHLRTVMDARSTLYQNQPPLDGPLSLPLAIARALTYNYDHRLAMMEGVFQSREMTVANLGMLPKLVASAGYTARDNESAARSISYFTRLETLEPSVSQERHRKLADISFSWSLLDFGLSYFQAKQYADRYLIMEERRRRVVNNIVKDVITTYWSVAMAETLLPQVNTALQEVETALANYEKAYSSGMKPLVENLDEEKRLLQISGGLKRMAADLAQSKIHLAALVNIPMDEPYSIVMPDEKDYDSPPVLPKDINMAENIALYMRPDLREDNYQERIDKNELNKEIVRMIPGITLVAGTNYDSNIYYQHNVWTEATARIASNLIGLISNYHQYRTIEAQIDLTRTKRLANMVAAMVQLRLAYHQYAIALQDYRDSMKIHDLEKRIYQITLGESLDGSVSDMERINRFTDLIVASLYNFYSRRAVYEAWGNFYFSLGGDMIKDFPEEATLEERAVMVQTGLEMWWAGNLPALPEQDSPEGISSSLPQLDVAEPQAIETQRPVLETQPAQAELTFSEIPDNERFDCVFQVGTFKNSAFAKRLHAKLKASGFPDARIEKDGVYHNVLVLFAGELKDVRALRENLSALGINGIFLRSKKPIES